MESMVGRDLAQLPFQCTTADSAEDSSEDRIQAMAALDRDWSHEEERALVQKLDIRLLTTCFVIFLLAYLDRGNIGSIRILQHGGPDSLEQTLKLKGTDFNWVSYVSSPSIPRRAR